MGIVGFLGLNVYCVGGGGIVNHVNHYDQKK